MNREAEAAQFAINTGLYGTWRCNLGAKRGSNHGAKWCAVCELWQPRRATHCKDCDCCVEEFDHHCPWMGKCVAKGNLMPFYIFTSMIGVVPVYLIMVLLLGPMLRSRK